MGLDGGHILSPPFIFRAYWGMASLCIEERRGNLSSFHILDIPCVPNFLSG